MQAKQGFAPTPNLKLDCPNQEKEKEAGKER